VSAAKYCSHGPTVDYRLADRGDDTAAAAGDFGSRNVEREEFTQKPGASVSVERKAGLFLGDSFSSVTRRGRASVSSRWRQQIFSAEVMQ
jgi:hypothetical protein